MRSLDQLTNPDDPLDELSQHPPDPFVAGLDVRQRLSDEDQQLEERQLPAEVPGNRPLVEIAMECGIPDRDLLKLDRFVRLVILENKPIAAAARLVGWRAERAWAVTKGIAYHEMRAELLARHSRTVDDIHNEIFNVVADTALRGAIKQNEIVQTSLNETLVSDVANKAMDRIGARAPERSQVEHRVELSEATVALIAKAFDAVKFAKEIDLERDFAFALKRPESDDDRAVKSIGTADTTTTEGR